MAPRRTTRVFGIVLVAIVLSGCRTGPAPQTGESEVSEELKAMADEDQRMRASETTDPQIEYEADLRHRNRVLELLAEGRVRSPEDRFRAALILQHTPAVLCDGRLGSQSLENYLLAHFLAKSAAEAGYRPARRMTAMTLDRYLAFSGRPQKYGTHSTFNEAAGRYELGAVDPATTDADRALWDVEPLAVLRGER